MTAVGLLRTDIVLPNAAQRVFHHRGTKADLGVIDQIFVRQDYALERLAQRGALNAAYERITGSGQTPLIMDAGANIGASAVWFASAFAQSHLVCFEPDPGNFALLERNCTGLDVDLRRAALGAQDGLVSLLDPGEGEWGYRTRADPQGSCPLIAMDRIVARKQASGYAPFLAKIDIEGGEAALFSENTGWIDLFALIIIELHDWLLPFQGTSRSFLRAMAARDRDFVHIGENIFSIARP